MDTSGGISYENHWQKVSVLQCACAPGVPVMLGIFAFHPPGCCRTYKSFSWSSWYKASSGRSFTYFEVWQSRGETAVLPHPPELLKSKVTKLLKSGGCSLSSLSSSYIVHLFGCSVVILKIFKK